MPRPLAARSIIVNQHLVAPTGGLLYVNGVPAVSTLGTQIIDGEKNFSNLISSGDYIAYDELGCLAIQVAATSSRRLYANPGNDIPVKTVDWGVGRLCDTVSGNTTLDWNDGKMYSRNYNGQMSVDWNTRGLYSSDSVLSVNWSGRELLGDNGALSLRWTQGLYAPSGLSLDTHLTAQDLSGLGLRMASDSRRAFSYDSAVIQDFGLGTVVWTDVNTLEEYPLVSYRSRKLYDVNGTGTLDWSGRQLLGSWSTNTSPSLSGHIINKGYLDATVFSVNTGVVHLTGIETITGPKTFNNIRVAHVSGVGTNSYINFGNEKMYDDAGIQSMDWGSRTSFDDVGKSAISWDDRVLTDTAEINSIAWGARNLISSSEGATLNWGSKTLSTNWSVIDPVTDLHIVNKRYLSARAGQSFKASAVVSFAQTGTFLVTGGPVIGASQLFLIDKIEVVTTSISSPGVAPIFAFGIEGATGYFFGPVSSFSNSINARHIWDIPQNAVQAPVINYTVLSGSSAIFHSGIVVVKGYVLDI